MRAGRTPGDPADYDIYRDLWLVCAKNGTLWKAVWQEWDANTPGVEWRHGWPYPDHPERITDAWEFRYDTGRERYFARHYDTHPEDPNASLVPQNWTERSTVWTDYLAEQPYVDYTVTNPSNGPPTATETVRYLAGRGVHVQEDPDPNVPATNLHADLIGSTMLLTEGLGGTAASAVAWYTAFGDSPAFGSWPTGPGENGLPEVGEATRYGYAGGWGYESGYLTLAGANPGLPPVTLQHVGWRWYQPGVGRFVQRDPIGLGGGLNTYGYGIRRPLTAVDPEGLDVINDIDQTLDYIINGPATSAAIGTGAAANYKWRWRIGRFLNRASAVCTGAAVGWNTGKWLNKKFRISEWVGDQFAPPPPQPPFVGPPVPPPPPQPVPCGPHY